MAINPITRLLRGSTTNRLRHELLVIVHGEQAIANRLIDHEKSVHPGHSEEWYLEKVIYDLRR